MGFRFRKSIKIAPGTHINLSKGGVGVSFHVGNVTRSFGPRGSRTTINVPHTGLSYVSTGRKGKRRAARRGCCGSSVGMLLVLLLALARFATSRKLG